MEVSEELRKEFEKQDLGSHMCNIYRNKEEQLSILSLFMSLGIKKNEKCLYIVDDRTKEEIVDAFKREGFNVEEWRKSDQFVFMTKSESYLKNGYFDPHKMIRLLENAQNEALEEGYAGLRLTGEMTWFFSDMPGVERLMEYESKLNEFLPDSKVVALCQYNEKKFSPEILVDVIRTHPYVIIYDDLHWNPYYMPPSLFTAKLRGKVTWEHCEKMKKEIIRRTQMKRREKEAKRKLTRERDRAQNYLETAEVMMVVIDRNGNVIQANRKASEVLGYDKEEIIGKNWFENFIPEREREEIWNVFQEIITNITDGFEYFENPVLTKNGKEKIIVWHNSILKDEQREIIGTLSSGMDITERKKAEQELQKNRDLLKRTQKISKIGGWEYDLKTKTMVWTDEVYRIHGFPVAGSIDNIEESLKCYHPEDRSKVKNAFEHLLDTGEGYDLEVRFQNAQGRDMWVRTISQAIIKDGQIVRVIGNIMDITERKKAREEAEFYADVLAHDMGNLNQVMLGYLHLLREAEDKETIEKNVENAKKAVMKAKRLAESIQILKNIKEKPTERIRLDDVLERSIERVHEHFDRELEINVKVDEPEVNANVYLDEVLFSVLENAVEYTFHEPVRIDISVKKRDGMYDINIRDYGIGISEQKRTDILENLETLSKRTGMGLYLVKKILDHYGGELDIHSHENGTEVILSIPTVSE